MCRRRYKAEDTRHVTAALSRIDTTRDKVWCVECLPELVTLCEACGGTGRRAFLQSHRIAGRSLFYMACEFCASLGIRYRNGEIPPESVICQITTAQTKAGIVHDCFEGCSHVTG